MNIVKVSSYYSGSKALNSLYFSRVGNSSSVADMWQKNGRDLHFRRKAPNLVYKGFDVCWIKKNWEASCEINETLSF